MKALIVKPGKRPERIEIGAGLSDMQEAVGGYIEAVYPYDDPVVIVCHEEGKLIGLPKNRALRDEEDGHIYDIVHGDFLIVGLSADGFATLSDELMDKYEKKFALPERFMRMGGGIMVFPFRPEDDANLHGKGKFCSNRN